MHEEYILRTVETGQLKKSLPCKHKSPVIPSVDTKSYVWWPRLAIPVDLWGSLTIQGGQGSQVLGSERTSWTAPKEEVHFWSLHVHTYTVRETKTSYSEYT